MLRRTAPSLRQVAMAQVGVFLLLVTSCTGSTATTTTTPSPSLQAGRADIGGYTLAYQCEGTGSPTVILEARYTASGIGTFGQTIQPAIAGMTRVCAYDRAGIGVSDARPASVSPLTSVTQARSFTPCWMRSASTRHSCTSVIPTAA